ncbi:MAG TPA: hypothetical protein VGF48_10515 [Thermoanaerobaculia bacterium]|jgi:hypothetical protein
MRTRRNTGQRDSGLPRIDRVKHVRLDAGRVLIVSAGFEDRTLAWRDVISVTQPGRCIVLTYLPFDRRNRETDVAAAVTSAGLELRIVEFDRYQPESFELSLRSAIADARSVVVDASTMSKLALLLCLAVCDDLDLDLDVLYTEAQEYGPSKAELDAAVAAGDVHRPSVQVYTGVHGVMRVARLSSVAMQGQPTAAVAFMSFNEYLTQALVDAVYPSRLFLINGRPPRLTWREQATFMIHDQLVREWPLEDNPVRTDADGTVTYGRSTSTLWYAETVSLLFDLYWQIATDYRVLLAPTGSKMQTLGCYIARAAHPDIHIEYPTPKSFFDFYSTGIAESWRVRFGKFGSFVNRVRETERRRLIKSILA